jgi:hypothetical protein
VSAYHTATSTVATVITTDSTNINTSNTERVVHDGTILNDTHIAGIAIVMTITTVASTVIATCQTAFPIDPTATFIITSIHRFRASMVAVTFRTFDRRNDTAASTIIITITIIGVPVVISSLCRMVLNIHSLLFCCFPQLLCDEIIRSLSLHNCKKVSNSLKIKIKYGKKRIDSTRKEVRRKGH